MTREPSFYVALHGPMRTAVAAQMERSVALAPVGEERDRRTKFAGLLAVRDMWLGALGPSGDRSSPSTHEQRAVGSLACEIEILPCGLSSL